MPPSEEPTVELADVGDWERWLEENHETASGVWLRFAKKGAPRRTVSYAEALEVALCFGWIDGQVRRLDEHFYRQRFTPRGPRSGWSKVNVEHVERLVRDGRMRPSGAAAVRAAKEDGRWAVAYDPPSRAEPPPELLDALAARPPALERWNELSRGRRYTFLYGIQTAKRPETRARRIAACVEQLAGEASSDPR